jgi:hypothetical protein
MRLPNHREGTYDVTGFYTVLVFTTQMVLVVGLQLFHINKQNSYVATNIEQDQHINQPLQQASDIHDLKNMMKSPSEQMGTMPSDRNKLPDLVDFCVA